MPFKKVENCNQVVKIGKQLKFSLVNIAGNDIVQGNKKLILAYLWQLMRFNILQLLKYLRSYSLGKEFTDADILEWATTKVRSTGSQSCMKSFKDKSLSDGIFFLELLSAVQPLGLKIEICFTGLHGPALHVVHVRYAEGLVTQRSLCFAKGMMVHITETVISLQTRYLMRSSDYGSRNTFT